MNAYLLIPLALGATVVTQATLNRQMGSQLGLSTAVAINAAVFLILSLGIYAIAKYTPTIVPEFFQIQKPTENFKLSYLIPGTCGFLLVMGLPWSIQTLGPSTSFVLLITAQIILSVILEATTSAAPPSLWKALGALLVLAGATLVAKF